MSVLRLDKSSDATWCRAWTITTTAEVATFLATFGAPLGPKRGDIILDQQIGQLFFVTGGGSATQLTGLAVLPIDLTTDVTGVLPEANGGTGSSDFYEEDDWIPALTFGGGNTGITYTFQLGLFTRIGRVVNLVGLMVLSNKGSSTGAAVISGLPYTAFNGSQAASAAGANFDAMGALVNNVVLSVINNTATMFPFTTDAGATRQLDDTDFTNTSVIVIQVFYFRA